MNDTELLKEASSHEGLALTDKSEDNDKVIELQRTRLIRLEEYNAPYYVYRITKKGKEYLREKQEAIG